MKPKKIERTIEKLDSIISAVKHQNSGADIHEVGSIWNTASLLKDQLETHPHDLPEPLVDEIVDRVHGQLVSFYKKKYWRNH